MEINVKYPEITAEEYIASIDDFNDEIDDRNRSFRLTWPRAVASIALFVSVILYIVMFRYIYYRMTWYITAKSELLIIFSLLGFVLCLVLGTIFVFWAVKGSRLAIITLLGGREYEERYSLLQFVERKDEDKHIKARENLAYYKMCDTLRNSDITDASIVCSEDDCRVDIRYLTKDTKVSGVFKFTFPYHYGETNAVTLVDFDRQMVILTSRKQEATQK